MKRSTAVLFFYSLLLCHMSLHNLHHKKLIHACIKTRKLCGLTLHLDLNQYLFFDYEKCYDYELCVIQYNKS